MTTLKTSRGTAPAKATLWTSDKIAILCELWATDMPTKAIGERIGFTKNSVIGKARRLKLASRLPTHSKVASKQTLSSSIKKVITAQKSITFMDLRHDMCSWINSDAIDHGVTFCGKRVLPSHSYCPEHCAKAFMKTTQPKAAVDFYTQQDVDLDDVLTKP